MSDRDPLVAELVAKQAITEVLHRYCRALDRMDRPLADDVWHPGGTADYGPGFSGTGEEFLDFVWGYHESLEYHSHQVTNVLIDLDEPAGSAGCEAYVEVWLRSRPVDGTVTETRFRGRYLDRFVRLDGLWGIDHRIYLRDFAHEFTRPAAEVLPSWGTRDTADASYGVVDL